MEAAAGAAAEPAAWAAEPFAEPEPGSDELEASGALDRVLRESVCQQQGWVRVYGEGRRGGERRKTSRPQLLSPFLFLPAAEAPNSPGLRACPLPGPFPEPRGSPCATPSLPRGAGCSGAGSRVQSFCVSESQDVCPAHGCRQG